MSCTTTNIFSIADVFSCLLRPDMPTVLLLDLSSMSPRTPPTLVIFHSPSCTKRSLLKGARAIRIRRRKKPQKLDLSRSLEFYGSTRSLKTSQRRNLMMKKGTMFSPHQQPRFPRCPCVATRRLLRASSSTSKNLTERKAQVLLHRSVHAKIFITSVSHRL